ncbi:MAG: hypothetical protein M5U28_48365 [Sandaracinaceae bacterium]|nr:hypothetical protein [Sandaracinaceae bacterium]
MTKHTLSSIALAILLFAHGCDGGGGAEDGGADASTAMDAGARDAAPDASEPGECLPVRVRDWRLERADDVSIAFRARIVPDVERQPWDLHIELNRYAAEYVGEFPLDEGQDANYGSCAHCVSAFYGPNREEGFYAREGTLVLRQDPFTHRLDATLRGVVLEEVRFVAPTLESVPVPGGACLALMETDVTGTFPPSGWRCPAEQYGEGEACHCSCGVPDPDCGERCPFLPPDPSCDPTPLPIAGCAAGDLCTFEGECAARCDHSERVACTSGVCGFSVDGDRCFLPGTDPIDGAAVGELCAPGERTYHCAVDEEGFAMGLCDPDDEWRCLPTCESDEDCTEPETCWTLYFDPESGTGQGVCKPPPPPCQETGTSCSDHLDCCTVLCEGLTEGGTGTCG